QTSLKSMHETSETLTNRSWTTEVARAARAINPALVQIRRHLHTHPELSMREFATTQFLAQQVEALGVETSVTQHRVGLTSDWSSHHAEGIQRRIGLRG